MNKIRSVSPKKVETLKKLRSKEAIKQVADARARLMTKRKEEQRQLYTDNVRFIDRLIKQKSLIESVQKHLEADKKRRKILALRKRTEPTCHQCANHQNQHFEHANHHSYQHNNQIKVRIGDSCPCDDLVKFGSEESEEDCPNKSPLEQKFSSDFTACNLSTEDTGNTVRYLPHKHSMISTSSYSTQKSKTINNKNNNNDKLLFTPSDLRRNEEEEKVQAPTSVLDSCKSTLSLVESQPIFAKPSPILTLEQKIRAQKVKLMANSNIRGSMMGSVISRNGINFTQRTRFESGISSTASQLL